jgi:hypothetical protein
VVVAQWELAEWRAAAAAGMVVDEGTRGIGMHPEEGEW